MMLFLKSRARVIIEPLSVFYSEFVPKIKHPRVRKKPFFEAKNTPRRFGAGHIPQKPLRRKSALAVIVPPKSVVHARQIHQRA
jgi:hypothetical protein